VPGSRGVVSIPLLLCVLPADYTIPIRIANSTNFFLSSQSVREHFPLVRGALLPVREGFPLVREGFPSVRGALPLVREGVQAVRGAVYQTVRKNT